MFAKQSNKKLSKSNLESESIQEMMVKLEPKDEESMQGGIFVIFLDPQGPTALRSPYEGCDPGTCCDPLS